MTTYLRLLKYLKPYWWAILLSILGFALNAATEVFVPKLFKYIIDAISAKDVEKLQLFPLLIIVLFIFRGVATFLGNYFSAWISRNLVYILRLEVFQQLLRLPQGFFLNTSSGKVSSKLIFDVEQVTAASTDTFRTIFRDGLTVIALLGYLFINFFTLSLTLFAVLPVIAGITSYVSRIFRNLAKRLQHAMGDVSHIVNETITGFDVVKNFGGQEQEFNRFQSASKANLKYGLKIVVTESIYTPLVQFVLAACMSFVVWLALRPEAVANLSAGDFISFLTAAGLLSKPVRALTQVNEKIQRGLAAADSVFGFIDTPAENDSGNLTHKLTGHMSFETVGLRYDDGTAALDGIDLNIKAGEMVAFVGRSGAGKTSLISLLTRKHDVTAGKILLDDVAIQDMTLASLRSQIASVNQNVMLFDTTVYENIAYGELANLPKEQVVAAAKAAYAHDFIEALPEGYQTQVGSAGQSLSGGQRQRIAIARALLKDAPILILDEATSALDNESEHHIQQALENAMSGRTTLVIAHRLSTIESADRIVVMDKGRIVEQGSHAALLEKNGLYANMHARNFADV